MSSEDSRNDEIRQLNQRIAELQEAEIRYREAEEKALENEERLRTLINVMPDIVCFKDGEGRWLEANDFDLHLFQLEGVQYQGKKDSELAAYSSFYRDAFLTCEETDEAAWKAGEISRADEIIPRPDGSKKVFDIFKIPTFYPNGERKGLLVLGRDVTQRREREEALRKSKERYRALVECAPVCIHEVDTDGRLLSMNAAGLHMIEADSEEAIRGVYYLDGVVERDRTMVREKLELALSGIACEFEFGSQLKPGGVFHTRLTPMQDSSGSVEKLIGVTQDISASRQAEADRILLERAIHQASEAVVLTDTEGTIQYVSPSFQAITGYSRHEAIGRNPRFLKSGKHSPRFYEQMWNQLFSKGNWSGRFINRRKDGTLYQEEVSISAVHDEVGRITNFVGVKRDVTREAALEEQLRHSQKMETVGTFAGGIAHDFNNILTPILGHLEMALEDIAPEDPLSYHITQSLKAARRASDLVRQILLFGRKSDADERHPLRAAEVVREALKLARSSLPSTIRIVEEIEDDSCVILGNTTQIVQVLLNLFANARHAIAEEYGTLSIGVKPAVLPDSVETRTIGLTPGEYVCIQVADDGVGMAPEVQERIFEPFFSTKEVGEGSGLGLSVVHGIVRNHGGGIQVESILGEGSIFRIFLPIGADEIQDQPEQARVIQGTERILLVDDEEGIVRVLENMLSRVGYKVTVARSGIEALRIMSLERSRFDLLVSDQTMPEMTGLKLIEEAKKLAPEIAVILISGYSDAIIPEDLGRLGIDEFLLKPFGLAQLSETVRIVIDAKRNKS